MLRLAVTDLLGWCALVPAGDDGVFGINKTNGRITLLTHPINLKREIFNVNVRVRGIITI